MNITLAKAEAYTHYYPSVITSETEIQLRRIESIDDNYKFHIRNFVAWMRPAPARDRRREQGDEVTKEDVQLETSSLPPAP